MLGKLKVMLGQQAKPQRLPRLPITLAVEVAEVGRCSLASTIARRSPTYPVALVTLASLTVEVAEVGLVINDDSPPPATPTNHPLSAAGRTPCRRR